MSMLVPHGIANINTLVDIKITRYLTDNPALQMDINDINYAMIYNDISRLK